MSDAAAKELDLTSTVGLAHEERYPDADSVFGTVIGLDVALRPA